MERTELLEALDTMCRRCINHDVCNGTGCHPRNLLLELIQERKNK